jgi:hypothetical protein
MSDTNFSLLKDQDPQTVLRAQRRALLARYDSGPMPPYVYAVVRIIETELAWCQHQQVRA